MATTYTYARTSFPAGINPPQLLTEVSSSSISVAITSVGIDATNAYFVFPSAISGPDQTTLAGVVANHIPDSAGDDTHNLISGFFDVTSTLNDVRAIQFNNGHASGGITLNAGSGGLKIGSTGFVYSRGSYQQINYQPSVVSLSDSSQTLTASQLLSGLLTIDPSTTRTLTLPTAANLVAAISEPYVRDSFDFTIINTDGSSDRAVLAGNTGATTVGNLNVYPVNYVSGLTSYVTSGSATFRAVITNISSGSEAYIVYRLA
jgi:hypothetical protein